MRTEPDVKPKDTTLGDARDRAIRAFRDTFDGEPTIVARAPGRVNIIGGHVDYSGGFVLPAAIDRDLVVAAAVRPDRVVEAVAADYEAEGGPQSFELDGLADAGTGWGSYVRGVAALLDERLGGGLPGARLAIAGDVPQGAGLSSSAALEAATATALIALADVELPREELAVLCRRAEVEWAGVSCGVMDQFISIMGRRDHALLLDARSLEYRHIPLPPTLRLVAMDSGISRELRGSAFNDRVEATRRAAEILGVPQLRDVSPSEMDTRETELPEPIRSRAMHVVEEIRRTEEAARALEAGEMGVVGRLVLASHESSRTLFQSSLPELDTLVAAAAGVDGVYGARLSGAGWGGCAVALAHVDAVPELRRTVTATYLQEHGRKTVVHVYRAAAGASAAPTAAD